MMVEVSAGVIVKDFRILCFQKGLNKHPYLSDKWEFPGGKVEPGEDPKETIIRELSEELKMNIIEQKIIHLCDTEYDYPNFHLVMHSFLIFVNNVKFTMTEHIDYKLCSVGELDRLDWAEADWAVVKAVREYFE